MRRFTGRLHKGRCTTGLVVTLVGVLTALTAASPAQAGRWFATADDCPVAPLEQPFLPWGDSDYYTLVPGGDFENDALGWSLDGAGVVAGNEPHYVRGADDSRSLSISSGGTATSETMCVGVAERTLRLFVRSGDPSPSSRLKVEVVVRDTEGSVRSQPLGFVSADDSTSWTPHPAMVIRISSHPLVNGSTPVQFRFTPDGPADWQIDDVYVDPRYH